ncbi:MAG: glycosyltransferase family 2 protein [Vulcanimicrobiota bacterium]
MNRISLSAGAKIWLSALLLWLGLVAFAPSAALAVAVLHLVATAVLVVGRLVLATPAPAPEVTVKPSREQPMVSVQIATYEEPPELVCQTLSSLAAVDYDNFEVIVLDNNTKKAELYEPVARYCHELGERFRFFHYDNVEGAKAGALNIALELTNPQARYVLVLDADYQVRPEMLREGVAHFGEGVALVQYPQAYRNGGLDCGLTIEYRHFFDLYMQAANRYDSVLATGTAAFISLSALKDVGGWPEAGLTEDADLGVRLQQAGYHGVYVPERLARGVMPETSDALAKQRRRWVLGNAQSLREVLTSPNIGLKQKLVLTFQLTAWANPLLWNIVTAIGASLWLMTSPAHLQQVRPLVALSVLGIGIYVLGTFALMAITGRRAGVGPTCWLKAMASHLGLGLIGALSWLELFVQSDKSFQRTDKFARLVKASALPYWATAVTWLLGLATLAGGYSWLGAGWLTLSLLPISRALLDWELTRLRAPRTSRPAPKRQLSPAA